MLHNRPRSFRDYVSYASGQGKGKDSAGYPRYHADRRGRKALLNVGLNPECMYVCTP